MRDCGGGHLQTRVRHLAWRGVVRRRSAGWVRCDLMTTMLVGPCLPEFTGGTVLHCFGTPYSYKCSNRLVCCTPRQPLNGSPWICVSERRKGGVMTTRTCIAVDLKSFYASEECVERGARPAVHASGRGRRVAHGQDDLPGRLPVAEGVWAAGAVPAVRSAVNGCGRSTKSAVCGRGPASGGGVVRCGRAGRPSGTCGRDGHRQAAYVALSAVQR